MSKWDRREKEKTAAVHAHGLTEMMRRNGVTKNMDPAFGALGKKSQEERFDKTLQCFIEHVPSNFALWANEDPFGGVERRPHSSVPAGQEVSITSMLFSYFLWRISGMLHAGVRVLEIGGGYGGLARVLAEYEPTIKMTMVDLSISLEIQRFYLANTSEAAFAFSSMVPDGPFDLAVSTKCFCELDVEIVNHYLTEIDRALRHPRSYLLRGGYFYCVSRDDWRENSFDSWRIPSSLEIVDRRVYPFEPNYTERLWRKI